MTLLQRLCAGLLLAGVAGVAWAQAAAVKAAAPAASAAARDAGTPTVTVIEDDGVRIEETRLRGQAQRIVVQSKVGGVRAYEIIVAPGGRDPSQDRGASGQRAWSLFNF
ncbi:MAG: hypothetical protein Q8M01_06060 [Rubrivivax sp.]|nr:hypothetical protein [Rubrivivax sp.]